MTSILIKSAMALGLGVASATAFAQTEQPAQGQAGECPPGMECPESQDGAQQQPEAQGGALEGEQQPGTGQGAAEQQAPAEPQPESDAAQQQEGEQQPTEGQAEQQPAQAEQPAEGEQQQTQEAQPSDSGADVDVTVEQKTEITQVIREQSVDPIDVDFEVSVGTAVPETVRVNLVPLPPRIVQVVPAYEGFLFFILADGRIVIVHPSTFEIVLIIV